MQVTKHEYIQLAQFRTAIRRFLRFSEGRARHAGITPQQHQLMLAIKGTPDRDWATPGELAEALQINHNAAVALVTRAQGADLVSRAVHPADHRSVQVSLTPRGEAILEALSAEHQRELARMAPVLRGMYRLIGEEVPGTAFDPIGGARHGLRAQQGRRSLAKGPIVELPESQGAD